MEIFQVAALGLVAGVLALLIRQSRPEIALLLSLVTGAMIFLLLLDRMVSVVAILQELAQRAKVNSFYLTTVLKVIGVAYLAEFSGQVLRDAGEGALAAKVEMAGKVIILVLAAPIMLAILEVINRLLA